MVLVEAEKVIEFVVEGRMPRVVVELVEFVEGVEMRNTRVVVVVEAENLN